MLAVCHTVLGVLAVEDGEFESGAELLATADRLRADVGASVPKFQVDDVERARQAVTPAE